MAPSSPEFEIVSPKGYSGTVLATEEIPIYVAAEPGLEDFLNSLPLKVVVSKVDLSPETSNFYYDDVVKQYYTYSKPVPTGTLSGEGYCTLGDKRSDFEITIG